MAWEVEFTDQFEGWWTELSEADQDKIAAAVNVLADQGPNLKRPLVGKIEGTTRHQHMKELIPARIEHPDPVRIRPALLGDPAARRRQARRLERLV